MNLAYYDIRHNLGRFLLTCVGLSLLLGLVLSMIGIYRGLVADAVTLSRTPRADLWVVEAGTRGPFAESSRIPGDTREAVARIHGFSAAGEMDIQQSVGADRRPHPFQAEVSGPLPPHRIVAGDAGTDG